MKLTEGISRMLCQIVVFCVFGISHLLNADVSITGIISKDVVLPCKFQPAPLSEILLHWTRDLPTGTIVVHSFYRETNQLSLQPIRYNGRTKIFIDKITNGNASLQLSGVTKADEGQYKCYVSTSEGKFELVTSLQVAAEWKNVKLDSPNMLTPGDSAVYITCSASGAYPKPSLLWQDENGNNLTNQASSKDSVDGEGLHNVKSILKIDRLSNKTYKCNIKIERLQKSWTATWKMQARFNKAEDKDITMTCSEFTNNDQVLKITWKFRETESSQLVRKCESIHQNGTIRTNCQTNQSEILINRNQSSLILQHINLKDAGEYICEVTTSNMTQMFTYTLTVSASRTQEETPKREHILAYVAALSFALFIVVLLYFQYHVR